MTQALRRRIARRFRSLLVSGLHRKAAFIEIHKEFGVSRRSVYRYCDEFGVRTP